MESINEPPGPSFVNETDFQADAFRDGKLQFNILLFYTVFVSWILKNYFIIK